MTKEEKKAQRERVVFIDFARIAGLQIVHKSVSSERPPKPDISCSIAGSRCLFELQMVIDQDLAHRIGRARKEREITVGFFSQDEPLQRAIRNKARKQYESGGAPIDLLLYYTHGQHPPPWPDYYSEQNLIPALQQFSDRWRRVWLYDHNEDKVLWTHPGASASAD